MTVEQACRSSLDGAGYGIIAKSPGFQSGQDLSVAFSDQINQAFGGFGQSAFSIHIEGGSVFIARITYRGDSAGRKTLFTHACVIPLAQYRSLMANEPGAVLSIDPLRMYSTASVKGGLNLTSLPLEKIQGEPLSLQEVREKYGLDRRGYAELIERLYMSVFRGKSLCINSQSDWKDAILVCREIAYAAVCALPPSMRETFTVSSAPDSRNTICALFRDCGTFTDMSRVPDEIPFPVPFTDVRFGENGGKVPEQGRKNRAGLSSQSSANSGDMLAPGSENPETVEEMFSAFVWRLAGMEAAALSGYLREMDRLICMMVRTHGVVNAPVILLADMQARREDPTLVQSVYLTDALMQQPDVFKPDMMNRILDILFRQFSKNKVCPAQMIMQRVLAWALHYQDEDLIKSVKETLRYTQGTTRLALVPALLEMKCSRAVIDMVVCLIDLEGSGKPEWSGSFYAKLFRWVYTNDVYGLCTQIWNRRKRGDYTVLDILFDDNRVQLLSGDASGSNKLFNRCEMGFLYLALRDLTDEKERAGASSSYSPSYTIRDDQAELIFTAYQDLEEDLRRTWLKYYLEVRQAYGNAKAAAVRIQTILERYSAARKDMDEYLRRPENRQRDVWEELQTLRYLSGHSALNLQYEQLEQVSREYNEFMRYNGSFERALAQRWEDITDRHFRNVFDSERHRKIRIRTETFYNLAGNAAGQIRNMKVSDDTYKELEAWSWECMWRYLPYSSAFTTAGMREIIEKTDELIRRAQQARSAGVCSAKGRNTELHSTEMHSTSTEAHSAKMRSTELRGERTDSESERNRLDPVYKKMLLTEAVSDLKERREERSAVLDLYDAIYNGEFIYDGHKLVFRMDESLAVSMALSDVAGIILRRQDRISWDTCILAAAGDGGNKGVIPDFNLMERRVAHLTSSHDFKDSTEISADDSVLLTGAYRDSDLTGGLLNTIDNKSPEVMQYLKEDLQMERGGLLRNLFRRK